MLAKNHFEDCPFGCNSSGMLLDYSTGKLVPCPHCQKRKKELLAKGYVETENETQVPLSEVLGIKSDFLSTKFVYESIIPDGEKVFIEEESMEWQKEVAENLYLDLTVGTLPSESICFGVGIKGRVDKFAYPMLAKAYIAGLKIGKFTSCSDFCMLAYKQDKSLEDYYTCDILFMLLNEGINLAEISSAKGLMQTRALKGKPTIFLSTWTIEACSALLGYRNEGNLFLAKPVFLEYKKSKNKKQHSSYINNMIGVENERLDTGRGVSMTELL